MKGSECATDQADSPNGTGGPSVRPAWTVYMDGLDYPQKATGPPGMHLDKSDYAQGTRGLSAATRTVRCSSTDRPQTFCHQKLLNQQIETRAH
jgi:hypothetical protein